ncbi:nitroreductase [Synergistales bacterium]|nr:nitroreductase [Synergistales bacterium]
MKRTVLILLSAILVAGMVSVAWADVELPKPQKDGGDAVFTLLEKRASGARGSFPKGEISIEELSQILWAATGTNRGGKGWTVPLAGGREPYVKIYALKRDGVFLYDWKAHSLKGVSGKNALNDITGDGFVRDAPVVLIMVADTGNMGSMSGLNGGNALAYTAAGAMGQNVYLAADSLGISARYMVSMKTDAVKRELKLSDKDAPLCIIPLGKR